MMFIGAQLEVYGNTVEWADVDGDGYLDLISSVGDSGIGTEETYVASGSLNEIIGRPRLVFNASEGAIADFNGDGLLDLVGALGTDDSSLESFAAISLQNSNGTFGPPSNLGIPTFLLFGWGYAACDVDGNGVADLLINISIDGYSAGTAVLMGRGDGTFDRLADVPDPAGVERGLDFAADLNGDGFADIVTFDVCCGFYNSLRVIRLGRGDGTFGDARFTSIDGTFQNRLFDFNRDGYLDFISRHRDVKGLLNGVSVYLGDATASYLRSVDTMVPTAQEESTVFGIEDLNDDGIPDALIVSFRSASGSSFALLGAGDGSFGEAIELPANPWDTARDFNRDGHIDLLSSGPLQRVMIGNGDGTFNFESPPEIASLEDPRLRESEAPDLDGDGWLDVAVRNRDAGTLTPLYGDGSGGFIQGSTRNVPWATQLSDMDGDGDADYFLFDALTATLTIHRTYGREDVRALPPITLGDGSEWLFVYADVDGDGERDIFIQDSAAAYALYGLGDIRFESRRFLGAWPVYAPSRDVPSFADVNGDGSLDVIDRATNGLVVRLATGPRSYGPNIFSPIPSGTDVWVSFPRELRVADFNGDGRTDCAMALFDGVSDTTTLFVFLANADGTFSQFQDTLLVSRLLLFDERLSDVDRDGDSDIVLMGYESASHRASHDAYIFLNDGTGSFALSDQFVMHVDAAPANPFFDVMYDVTGEGVDDLVKISRGGGLSVSVSAGDGTFLGPYHFAVESHGPVTFGDFDGDGDADIVAISNGEDAVTYLENRYVD